MQPAAGPYFKRKDITKAICGPCCGLFQVFANHFHRFIGSYFPFGTFRLLSLYNKNGSYDEIRTDSRAQGPNFLTFKD
jgi:hypothetical protein